MPYSSLPIPVARAARLSYRLRTVRIGGFANFAMVAVLAVLPFLSSHGEFRRTPYFAILGTGLLLATVVTFLPWRRIIGGSLELPALYAWAAGNVLLITLSVPFTGGSTSELFYLYVLTTVFWAASYPVREQVLLLLFTLGCYGVVLGLSSTRPDGAMLALRVATLTATAYLAGFLTAEMRRQLGENEYLARHDLLTGLPNRLLFHEQLQGALSRRSAAGVILLDLDRFKEVNNVLGHGPGDRLLRQVGPRLQGALSSGSTVARIGGDEFAVLLEDVRGAPAAGLIAGLLLKELEQPFVIDEVSLAIEASMGIALAPEHGNDPDTLMRAADSAMYAAKEARSGYELYLASRDEESPERLELLGGVRRALEHGELVVHYQPIVEMASRQLQGVEALVRWQHPERGLVPPGDFIPLVEQTSLIRPLTRYVLEEAVMRCAEWSGLAPDFFVSVNLSARVLGDSSLPWEVARMLDRFGIEPRQLELTESTIMDNPARARDVLRDLASRGMRLFVDDFGTGHSSLAYLKELPVAGVKIDRSFANDVVIVRSVLNIARNLGLVVVAEGIETEASWDQIAALDCDLAQGYYLSRPLPAEEVPLWASAWAARVAA